MEEKNSGHLLRHMKLVTGSHR